MWTADFDIPDLVAPALHAPTGSSSGRDAGMGASLPHHVAVAGGTTEGTNDDAWSLLRFAGPFHHDSGLTHSTPPVSLVHVEPDPWCLLAASTLPIHTHASAPIATDAAAASASAPTATATRASVPDVSVQARDGSPGGAAASSPDPTSTPAHHAQFNDEGDTHDAHDCALLSVLPLADLMASPLPPTSPQPEQVSVEPHHHDRTDIRASGIDRASGIGEDDDEEEEEEAFALCGRPLPSATTLPPIALDLVATYNDAVVPTLPPQSVVCLTESPPPRVHSAGPRTLPNSRAASPISTAQAAVVAAFAPPPAAVVAVGVRAATTAAACAHGDDDDFVPPDVDADPMFHVDDGASRFSEALQGTAADIDYALPEPAAIYGATPTVAPGPNTCNRTPPCSATTRAPTPPAPDPPASRVTGGVGRVKLEPGVPVELRGLCPAAATTKAPLSTKAGARRARSASRSTISEYDVDADSSSSSGNVNASSDDASDSGTVYSQCSSTASGSLLSDDDDFDSPQNSARSQHPSHPQQQLPLHDIGADDPWNLNLFMHPPSVATAAAAAAGRAASALAWPAGPADAMRVAPQPQHQRGLLPLAIRTGDNAPPSHTQAAHTPRPVDTVGNDGSADAAADAYRGFRRLRDLNPEDETTPFAVRFGLVSARAVKPARGRGAAADAQPATRAPRGGRRGRTAARAPRNDDSSDSGDSGTDGAAAGGRARTAKNGGSSSSKKLPLRADGGLYAYSWATVRGRRILTYNGTKYAGSKAHKMWGLIKDAESGGGRSGNGGSNGAATSARSHRTSAAAGAASARNHGVHAPAAAAAAGSLEAILSQQLARNSGTSGVSRAPTSRAARAPRTAATTAIHGPLADALFGTATVPPALASGAPPSSVRATAARPAAAVPVGGGSAPGSSGGLLHVLGRAGPSVTQQQQQPVRAPALSVFEAAALLRARRAGEIAARAVERADAYDAPALDLLPPDLFDDSLRSL